LRNALVLAGFLALTNGALATNEPPDPEQQPQQQAAICTKEYRPVCGEIAGKRETYSNACMARAVKATILRRGACRDS
jgi:hypothetical protein